jgi:hypothetical protein
MIDMAFVPDALRTITRPERATLIASVILFGILAGMTLGTGGWYLLLWLMALSGLLALTTIRLAAPQDQARLLILAGFALATHMLGALVLHAIAGTAGSGFITGDDAAYFRVSSEAARYVLGAPMNPDYSPPLWGGDAYLFGTYVFLETGLFVVFGPDVRIALVLNATLAVLGAIFAYSIASRLFGRGAAFATATIIAFYPSLFLWSSLNLKDALTNALAILAIWQLMRLSVTPRIGTVLILFVAVELLVGLRAYVAAVVAIAALITVATISVWTRRHVADVTQLLATFERTRSAMAVGARTAFVPTATPAPTAVPLSPAPAESPSAGRAEPTSNGVRPSGQEDPSLSVRSTLSHLPLGLAYALFAPVPFLSFRAQELVTAPEMLFWYVLLTAALLTIWHQQRKWRTMAPLILMASGLTLVLALAEGNTGTLFRHRGMVVPFVVVLASPVLVKLFNSLATFRAAKSARVSTRLSRWPTR